MSRAEFVRQHLHDLSVVDGKKFCVVVESDVTGYFVYTFKPEVGRHLQLQCIREPNNEVAHTNAMLVCSAR